MNAESELEAVGMAWGAAATGARAATGSTGQGPVPDAGIALRAHVGGGATGHLQHVPQPGRLLPGHPGRRARRLPADRPRPAGRAGGDRAHAARVPPGRQVAEPRPRVRRLPARPHPGSRRPSKPRDFGALPGEGLGRRRVAHRFGMVRRTVTPARRGQDRATPVRARGQGPVHRNQAPAART